MAGTATPDYLNVTAAPFNAPNDYSADAGAGIAAAIAAAANPHTYPTGISVYLPAGKYKIANAIANLNTTGSITSGSSTLTVASAANLAVGHNLLILGAGAAGANLLVSITNVAGTTLTVSPSANTTVTNATVILITNSVSLIGDGAGASQLLLSDTTDAIRFIGPLARIELRSLYIGNVNGITSNGGTAITIKGLSTQHTTEIDLFDIEIADMYAGLFYDYADNCLACHIRITRSDSGITSYGGYPVLLQRSVTHHLQDIRVTAPGTGVFGYNEPLIVLEGDTDTIVIEDAFLANTIENVDGVVLRDTIGGSTGPRLVRLCNVYIEYAGNGSNRSDGLNLGYGGDGFNIADGRDVRLIGCHAANNSAAGFDIYGGASVTLESCLALQNQRHGFVCTAATPALGLHGCTASDNGQYATTGSITHGTTSLALHNASNFAVNDHVSVAGAGSGGGNLLAKITALVGTTATLDTAAVNDATNALVTGTTPAFDGIRLDTGTDHARVTGCRAGDFILGGAMQRYGLSTAASTDYVVAVANDLTANQTASLGNFSTGSNNQISLNAT